LLGVKGAKTNGRMKRMGEVELERVDLSRKLRPSLWSDKRNDNTDSKFENISNYLTMFQLRMQHINKHGKAINHYTWQIHYTWQL
jgi:hypothetical protein